MNTPELQQCAGERTLTEKLQADIRGAVQGWLTGGQFPYGTNIETKGILFLTYEAGKTLKASSFDSYSSQIFSDSQHMNEIFKAGANNPDAKADAVFLGLPLKSNTGTASHNGPQ